MIWEKYALSKAKNLVDFTIKFTNCRLLTLDKDLNAWFARLVNIYLRLIDNGNKSEYRKNFEIKAHILNQ